MNKDKSVGTHLEMNEFAGATDHSLKDVKFDINEHEYGLTRSTSSIDIHFQPSEYGILDSYSVLKEIYKVQLSPTIISLTTHKETNQVRLMVKALNSVESDKEEYK